MTKTSNLADILVQQIKKFEINKPNTARAYEKFVEQLQNASSGGTAPSIGDYLPSFRLPDENGYLRNLQSFLQSGPLVISLNRGHWCAFCQYELDALQDINAEVIAMGGSIVTITPESQRFAKRLKSVRNLNFPVLCDVDNAYALMLGLAIWCDEEIKSIYAKANIDIARYQNNSQWLLPIPATFVISTDGKIAGKYVNADFRYRMEPNDILRVLGKSN